MDDLDHIVNEIIKMKDYDLQLRQKLIDSGDLFNGYNNEMEEVHISNTERLNQIIDEIGWPSKNKFGAEVNDAAMIIVQHAISVPWFQRKCLKLIEKAINKNEDPKRNYAFLYDRICFNERRPQKFGTQYDWDEQGNMSPWKIEDPQNVNELRNSFGLNTIEEETEYIRKGIIENKETPPGDFNTRQSEIDKWSKITGWIK